MTKIKTHLTVNYHKILTSNMQITKLSKYGEMFIFTGLARTMMSQQMSIWTAVTAPD